MVSIGNKEAQTAAHIQTPPYTHTAAANDWSNKTVMGTLLGS
jgi:hypothetical protein